MLARRLQRTSSVAVFYPACDWRPMTRGLNIGLSGNPVYAFAADDDNDIVVGGFFSGYASRSIDGGASWTELPRNLNSGSSSSDIFALATDDKGIWVAGFENGWAAISIDDGATWSALPRWLNSGAGSSTQHINSIATDGKGNWVAVLNAGYAARSVDGGATWGALTRGLNCGSSTQNILEVVTDTDDVWMTIHNNGYTARSVDGGATWAASIRGLNLNPAANNNIACFATDTNGVWIALSTTGAYFTKSIDNGVSWTGFDYVVADTPVNIISNKSGLWIALHDSVRSYFSRDDGSTWNLLPENLHSGSFGEAGIALAFGGHRFFASFEDGYVSRVGKDVT